MSAVIHFATLVRDPHFARTLAFIRQHTLAHELHLNRVRFWIPEGAVLTEFLLRFEHVCPVSPEEDLATGRINTLQD